MIRHFTINRLTAIVARSILLTMLCGMLFLCNIRGLQAQGLNFPVRADVSIAQPFSPYLEDYTLPQFDRFVLTLNLMDWYNQDQVDVYLQLRLKRINPKPETIRIPADGDVLSQPADKVFQINKGFPSILNGSQLTHLFNYTLDNEGLKEGTYVFQVVVFEAGTGRQLSSVNFDGQIINITRNEPPFLNLPMNGTTVNSEIYPPSPILFQWTPRHILFDPNAGAVNYVLEIWGFPENDLKKDPNNYVQTAAPIFQTLVTGGQTTFLLDYTTFPMDNVFWEAKRYAWRVTAVDETVVSGDLLDPQTDPQTFWSVDAGQNHYFSNLGRSEVFSYYYAHPCNQPDLLHIHTDNPQEIEVQVIRESNHTSFDFLYREFESDVAFSTIHTTESILTLNELRPATTYELSVKAYCDKITAPIRDLGNVTTLDEYLDACEEPAYMTMTEEQIVDAADESITYQQFNFEWEDQHIELSWNVTLTLVDDGGDATQQLTGPFLVSGNTLSISAAPGGLLEGIDMSPFEHITILIERTCADDTEIDETYTFALDGSNSVQGDCKAPDPVYMTVEDVDDPTLEMEDPKRLTWTANSSHHHFDFNYRDRHNSQPDEWTTHPNLTENSLILDKLAYNLQYAYTITYYCNAAGTDFATSTENSFFIKNKDDFTDNVDEGTGSCFAPASTLVEFISTTSVKIYWDKAKKNVGYQFMYRKVGASGWEIFNQFERDIELTGLEEDTDYEYQVRTECEDGWSLYTDKETFTTPITTPSRTNSTPCEKVTDLQLADPGATATVLNLKFSEKSNYTGFYVEYKSEDQGVNDWYKDVQTPGVNLNDNDEFVYYSLKNLYEDTQYDVRITVACGVEEKTSNTFKFSTIAGFEPLTEFSCGDVDIPCEFPAGTNTEDGFSDELKETDIFTMGGFELQVVAQAQGTYDGIIDGSFTGNQTDGYTGFAHVVVPYMNMAQVEVYFSGVKVKRTTDDKLCAVEGNGVIQGTIIRVIPQEWSDQLNGVLGQIEDGLDQIESYVEMTATMLEQMETLLTTITDPIDMTPYENMTAEELFEEGMKLYDEFYPLFVRVMDGDVQGIEDVTAVVQNTKLAIALLQAAYELGVEAAQEIRSLDCTADRIVVFSEFENADHFDALSAADESVFKDFYEILRTKDEPVEEYHVPYVAINEGQFDYVTATVTMDDFENNFDKITFVKNSILGQAIGQNDELEAERIGTTNSFKVRVPSDAKRVFALYDDNGSSLKLGKLEVIECKRIDIDLVLVPNSETSRTFLTDNITTIEERINAIYNIPNVHVVVSVGNEYTNQPISDLTVTEDNHKFMSLYTQEMQDLEDGYFTGGTSKASEKTYYIFVVNSISAGGPQLNGYMPRNKDVGFITLADGALLANDRRVKTIAHELAHGALKLQHTWDVTDENIPQDDPTNLMSYGNGVDLRGFQWALIQDPAFDIYWLDKTSDVAEGTVFFSPEGTILPQISPEHINSNNSSDGHHLRFLNAGGEIIEIDNRKVSWYRFGPGTKTPEGALLGFVYEGVTYWANYHTKEDEKKGMFSGYFNKGNPENSVKVAFTDFSVVPGSGEATFLWGEFDGRIEGGVRDCNTLLHEAKISNINSSIEQSYAQYNGEDDNRKYRQYLDRFTEFQEDQVIGLYNNSDHSWCNSDYHTVAIDYSWYPDDWGDITTGTDYETWFQQKVEQAADKLDEHITNVGTNINDNDYNSDQWKHIVDGAFLASSAETYHGTFDFTDLTREKLTRLEHKLKYMNEYIVSNDLNEDREMYVLPFELDHWLKEGDEFRFAKLVLERSEKLAETQSILVTLPYTPSRYFDDLTDFDRAFVQPAYSYSSPEVMAALSEDREYYSDKIYDFVFEVYKAVRKPSHIHYGLVSVDGSIIYKQQISGSDYVTGRPAVKEIVMLYKQQYLDVQNEDLNNTTYSESVPSGGGAFQWVPTALGRLKFESFVAQKMEEAKFSPWLVAHYSSPDEKVRNLNKYDFKEIYMDDFAYQYIIGFCGQNSFTKYFEAVSATFSDQPTFEFINETVLYNFDVSALRDEVVYATLDISGVFLSLYGLDFVTDGVGFIYSVANGNALETTIYGVAIAVPLGSSYTIKRIEKSLSIAKSVVNNSFIAVKEANVAVSAISSFRKIKVAKKLGIKSIEESSSTLGTHFDDFIERVQNSSGAGITGDDFNSLIREIEMAGTDAEKMRLMLRQEIRDALEHEGVDISYLDELEDISRHVDDCDLACTIDNYGCFVAGTKIKTDQGYKNIENVIIGDLVWSYNHGNSSKVKSKVEFVKKKQVGQLYEIKLSDGLVINTTANHPFFTNDKYVEAQYLKKGDWVKSYGNDKIFIDDVVSKDTVVWVYNFTVADNENYFVSGSEVLVHNDPYCFFKDLQDNASDAFKNSFDQLSEIQKKQFVDDLGDRSTGLFDKFNEDGTGELVNAWTNIYNARGAGSAWKKDPSLLDKVAELRGNGDFMQNIGGPDELEKLLKANVRAGCKTCGDASQTFLKDIDDYLDDVEHFVTNYNHLEGNGFEEVLAELKKINSTGSPNYAMEGAAFMIDKIKRTPEITPSSVKRFDGRFEVDPDNVGACTNCRFDIELKSGIKYEYKSYSEASIRKIASINDVDKPFLKQHISYLEDAISIDNIKYEFDLNKLPGNYTVNGVSLSAEDFIKSQFKKMYNTNAEDILDVMNLSIKAELNISETAISFTDAQLNLLFNKMIQIN